MVLQGAWRKHALKAGVALAVAVLAVASICVVAGTPRASAHANAGGRAAGGPGWRQVTYQGYTFQVPRSWPVVNLADHPATCVRFDRHAVYLGQPGTHQSCPSNLVGATEAVLVQPASGQPATTQPAGTSLENPVAHQITVRTSRVSVTADYRGNRGQILKILASAGLRAPAVQNPARMAAQSSAVHTVPGSATNDTGKGFDPCTAPSAKAMSAWLANSSYTAVGIYIGGSDRACAQPALTNGWVRQQTSAGWHFFPLYVGPQVSFGEVSTHSAGSQAVSAAQDAVTQAKSLGFGSGSPIYYDMESYSPSQRQAALTFFSSWTTELHALGYRAGVYSSSSSGISDLANNYNGGKYAMPDVIDDAWWNGLANTADPNVPAGAWSNHHRMHQYSGNVTQTHGGYKIAIDQDYLDIQLGAGAGGGGGGGSSKNSLPARQSSQAIAASGSVVDAFYAGSDKKLWVSRYRPNGGWAAPVSLGQAVVSEPSAVTAPKNVTEVFYRSTGNQLKVIKSTSGGGWSRPRSLRGSGMGSAPQAVSTATGGIDVFWRGKDTSQLWGMQLRPGGSWRGPFHVASGVASAPSPAVSGSATVNVFWQGTDGRLWHTSSSGQSWRAPAALAMGQLGTGPHATGEKGGQVDVFWGGTARGSIWHTSYAHGSWARQSMIALGRHSVPALVASSAGTTRAFWKGQQDALWNATGHGGLSWGPAAGLSMGKIGGGVFAAGRTDGVIDVFWQKTGSSHLWHARYHPAGNQWSGPDNLGGNPR